VAQVNMGPANPGWEEDMAGWDNYGGGSVVTDAAKANRGNKYLQLSTTGPQVAVGSSYVLGVTPGQSVTFGGWAYRESGSGRLRALGHRNRGRGGDRLCLVRD